MHNHKTLAEWFEQYSESHQNKINKIIHFLCVPAIYFTVAGFLWLLPSPDMFGFVPGLNWASLSVTGVVLFYARLSITISVGMAFFSALCLGLLAFLETQLNWSVLAVSTTIFVISWCLQFVGHALEGKKPSFFEDMQFLMIGPAWVMGFIYQKLGIPLTPAKPSADAP